MTKYNWNEMTPRQRDALVAEKVMGWIKSTERPQRWITDYGALHEDYWRPTSSIAAAWEVVEKMRSNGWEFELDSDVDRINEWCATFVTLSAVERGISPKAPEAICLAALRAVGVDVE
jgi:hypothetical protein